MLDPSGGFYSTQDADSEGEEGKFFVWDPDEISVILGEEDARIFCFYYDVSASGNFEGKNILNVPADDSVARSLNITNERLIDVLDRGRKLLFAEREKRIKPGRDEKVLTAWNGLMLAAFAEAGAILADAGYLGVAKRNADFLLEHLVRDGRLLRTWKRGAAKLNGYLEDYANVADGLIELYQASGEVYYLTRAREFADLMITEFWDEENGGFYFTSNDHEELIVRNKDFYDNATPSGNSAAADVLSRLAKLVGDEKYGRFAISVLRLTASQLRRYPQGFGRALSAIEFNLAPIKEVVIIGPTGNDLERELRRHYLPNAVIVLSSNPGSGSVTVPLLMDRGMVNNNPTAFVCESSVCQLSVTTAEGLRSQLI
jgi:uncharacterized protein YyaL (SSP411 family)